MRRPFVMLVAGINLALLVATSAADEVTTDSSPIPMELRLDDSTPDQVLEVEYRLDDEDGYRYGSSLELTLIGDNTLPPGDAVLQLYAVAADVDQVAPDALPLAEVPIGGQVGEEPYPVDVWLGGPIELDEGHHTTRLLLHLEGTADLALEGELLIGVDYRGCTRFFGECAETTVRIVDVR